MGYGCICIFRKGHIPGSVGNAMGRNASQIRVHVFTAHMDRSISLMIQAMRSLTAEHMANQLAAPHYTMMIPHGLTEKGGLQWDVFIPIHSFARKNSNSRPKEEYTWNSQLSYC